MITNNQELILKELSKFKPVMSEIGKNEETWKQNMAMIYEWLKGGFEVEEIRKFLVPVRFHPYGEEFKLEIRHLYTHMCLWIPHMREKYLTKMTPEEFTVDCYNFTSNTRCKFIDDKIIKLFRDTVDNAILNSYIHDALFELALITNDFALLLGGTINLEGFVDLFANNERFREIVNTKFDPDEQPSVIEAKVDALLSELLDLLGSTPNPLQEVILTGQVKAKQLAECLISMTYRPDESGRTLPVLVNTNLMMNGLSKPSYYYLEAQASRKSLLANAFEMGNSGYFSKMLVEASAGHVVAKDAEGNIINDCGTVKLVEVEIKSKKHLKSLNGRYYTMDKDVTKAELMSLITDETNPDDLVGQTIYLRSPLTCGCKKPDGSYKGICATCYGELTKINHNLNIGSLAGAKTSEPVGQTVLSTKHIVTTHSVEIAFTQEDGTDEFNKYCQLASNEINFRDLADINPNTTFIYIDKEDVATMSDDEGKDFNVATKKFTIVKSDGSRIEIKENNEKLMYMSPELALLIMNHDQPKYRKVKSFVVNNAYIQIPIGLLEPIQYEDGEEGPLRIFVLSVDNNETTAPFYEIMELLNYSKPRRAAGIETVDQLNQRLFDLIITAGISVPSVFMELCWVDLLRDADSIIEYPTWTSKLGANNYQMITLSTSLQKNPSVTTSIGFNKLGEQFSDITTYEKKAPSLFDSFFMVNITKNKDKE